MSLYDSLRKNLTPELFTQVTDALGDDFDFDLVPRSRLNKVIKQRNDLRDQLAAGSQSAGGKGTGTSEEDDDETGGTPSVNIDELKRQLQKEQTDAINAVKIQYAALDKLRAAEVVDPELLWSSNVFDKKKLVLNDDGTLTGMDEALEQLKKDKTYLFKQADQGVKKGTGKEGGIDFEGVTSKEDFLKLDLEQQIAFKKANPEVFKTFL
jgi:hypothetical protein